MFWRLGSDAHCLVSRNGQKGNSLPALQRRQGDDTLLPTEIYLNLSPEHVVEEFQQKW